MSDEPNLAAVGPGRTVGFVGLGNMGYVMAGRLLDAGYAVRGYDTSPGALTAFGERPGAACAPTAAAPRRWS